MASSTGRSSGGVRDALGEAEREGRQAAASPGMKLLARVGYAAKGIVYLILGGLATKVALGEGGTTTDRTGALRAIHEQPFGKFLLALVAIGLTGYAAWSLVQALVDPERKGTDAKGIIARLGYGAVGLSYAALALGAAQLVIGTGNGGTSSDTMTQDWTARFLALPFGPFLVVLAGLIVLGVAGYLVYRAYTADFQKTLTAGEGGAGARPWVIGLGRAGYAALGVVFGIVGVFLIIAAVRGKPGAAKGLGGALRELAQQPYGHVVLGIVAIGLVAYGLFSLAQARYRSLGTT
ncbi:MAG TPA: DUF1206 domain-containing protein [Chloroflexota bacterium]|nr:DUF1206 domain-containing protein [Chloroflexota bacterium]